MQHIATRVPAAIGTLILDWLPDKFVPARIVEPPTHGVLVVVCVLVSKVKELLFSGAVASTRKGYTFAPAGGVKLAQFELVK